MRKYQRESGDPKYNAQRNLSGRSHYVDDDTLRYFHARIISTREYCDGLLFGLVESTAKDPQNRERGFRFSVFDLCGNVVNDEAREVWYTKSDKAIKAMEEWIAKCDPIAINKIAINRMEKIYKDEIREMRVMIKR